MSSLEAEFELQYPMGSTIRAAFTRASTGFSITALFGPSGSGKTTVLRCLAGLERPQRGTIVFDGEVWFDSKECIHRTPWQRNVGYLFQEYALFPHLTISENIAYGLRRQTASDRNRIVNELMERFELSGKGNCYPQQVSGGQQQRAALARTLARRPSLLLLDEPLAALDSAMQDDMRYELRQVLTDFAIPMFLVTHDRNDAIALADHLLVMDQGRILQSGKGEVVFKHPADERVAKMVGVRKLHYGRIVVRTEKATTIAVGDVQLTSSMTTDIDQDVLVCIRAEDVEILPSMRTSGISENCLAATVRMITVEGALIRLEVDCGFALSAVAPSWMVRSCNLDVGTVIRVRIPEEAIHLI